EEGAVAGAAGVGGDDVVVGRLLGAGAAQPQVDCHVSSLFSGGWTRAAVGLGARPAKARAFTLVEGFLSRRAPADVGRNLAPRLPIPAGSPGSERNPHPADQRLEVLVGEVEAAAQEPVPAGEDLAARRL